MSEVLITRRGGSGTSAARLITETITYNTTWTVPAYAKDNSFTVRIFGAGGGGGGSSAGSAGAMNNKVLTITPGTKVAVTVGAGGLPKCTGGTTSFGSYLSAVGGNGGGGGWSVGGQGVMYIGGGGGGEYTPSNGGTHGGGGGSVYGSGADGGMYGGGGGAGQDGYDKSGGSLYGGNGGKYGGGGGSSTKQGYPGWHSRNCNGGIGGMIWNNVYNSSNGGWNNTYSISGLAGNGGAFTVETIYNWDGVQDSQFTIGNVLAPNGINTSTWTNVDNVGGNLLRGAGTGGWCNVAKGWWANGRCGAYIRSAGGGGGYGGIGGKSHISGSNSSLKVSGGGGGGYGGNGGSGAAYGGGGGGGYGGNGGHTGGGGGGYGRGADGGNNYGGGGGYFARGGNNRGGGGGYGRGGEGNTTNMNGGLGAGGGAKGFSSDNGGWGGSGVCIIQYYV